MPLHHPGSIGGPDTILCHSTGLRRMQADVQNNMATPESLTDNAVLLIASYMHSIPRRVRPHFGAMQLRRRT